MTYYWFSRVSAGANSAQADYIGISHVMYEHRIPASKSKSKPYSIVIQGAVGIEKPFWSE